MHSKDVGQGMVHSKEVELGVVHSQDVVHSKELWLGRGA